MANSPRLNKQTFREWAANPRTQAFLGLLKAQRDLLADQWARGQEMDQRQQCKALLLQELSTLNWADVELAYEKIDAHAVETAEADAEPPEETESGAQ